MTGLRFARWRETSEAVNQMQAPSANWTLAYPQSPAKGLRVLSESRRVRENGAVR